ncbi:MAG TPA: hypothetical protein VMB74_15315 [Streptosporangiaceae bacterium]|nr:hypothetical protein [Streptosporangiaceae bacterium]
MNEDASGVAVPFSGPPSPVRPPAADQRGSGQAGSHRQPAGRNWPREILVLLIFLAVGIAATWPRASLLNGRLPLSSDQSQDVWSLWWVARQVVHLHNPWYTSYLAAPVGVQLGYDTLSPLLGLLMAPVTLLLGPSVSYNLLVVAAPGVAAYAMYRAARLWLPSMTGAIAAGAFFGFSAMLTSQDWSHMHTAFGCVFLPLTLETAARLRRDPTLGRGILAGVVAGAALLVDQESAVLVAVVAAAVLVPWLVRRPGFQALKALAAGAMACVVVASPQLLAMIAAGGKGGPELPPAGNYIQDAAQFPSLFSPSPQLGHYGLAWLAAGYSAHNDVEMTATFGVVLSALAILGLIVSWRRSAAWKLAVLWLGSAAVALGPTLYVGGHDYVPLSQTWRGIRVSLLMPYTWLVRLPVLASFREADRWALLGLVGAALLAGAAVDWLRQRAWPAVIVVALLAAPEAGWAGPATLTTVPTSMPALDAPIAADHSGSVVIDIPYVVRGPERYGSAPAADYPLVLATEDGHPRAMSYTAGVPARTIAGIQQHAFYADLVAAGARAAITSARLGAARQDLRTLNIGWALVWTRRWAGPVNLSASKRFYADVERYLAETGFKFDYAADGVLVYRLPPARE